MENNETMYCVYESFDSQYFGLSENLITICSSLEEAEKLSEKLYNRFRDTLPKSVEKVEFKDLKRTISKQDDSIFYEFNLLEIDYFINLKKFEFGQIIEQKIL
jgi:hypothetical protein